MKIGVLIGHPTQFEGPFFRYASQNPAHQLRVTYINSNRMSAFVDPELDAKVDWGIDLLSGYDYTVLPRRRRYRWLWKDLKAQKYDLYVVNGYAKPECLFAAVAARMTSTPVALRLDTVPYNNRGLAKRLIKRCWFAVFKRLFHHFLAIGSLTVEYLQSMGVSRNRISIFSYAVDTGYFESTSTLSHPNKQAMRCELGIAEGNRVILSVCKFSKREAPWDLLRAFCGMKQGELTLLLVGDGPQRSALEEYARTHSRGQVLFPGYVPYPRLPAVYAIADLFVHPSHDEPWGVSVAEALACGLPVIASSRVGAAYDLIEPGGNGSIYAAGNARDLRGKIVIALRTLQPTPVRELNGRILSSWDYNATNRSILETARLHAHKRRRSWL
jgi:glycosyltransferase involved in cell wall biosynthesis